MAETPYVVMFHAVNLLSGESHGPSKRCEGQIQEAWKFVHPRKSDVLDHKGELQIILQVILYLS